MRPLLFAIVLLASAFMFNPAYAEAITDINAALESSTPEGTIIVMEYRWVYGIEERVELRGDGLVRVARHVHDRDLFNQLRAELAEKGRLSPYHEEMYAMEEGDYDRYWVGDAGAASFKAIAGLLVDIGFPDIEETYGDWEVFAITLKAGGDEARVGQVIRDIHPGFESALDAIEELAGIAKGNGEVDAEEFLKWFSEPKTGMGGAS